jgi:hypothetical protein
MATGNSGSPNGIGGADLTIFLGIWTHSSRQDVTARFSDAASQLRLEAAHLAQRSCPTVCRFADSNPTHRRIVALAFGAVHVL